MLPQLSASSVPLKVPFIKHVISLLKYPNHTEVPGSQCEHSTHPLGICKQQANLPPLSPGEGWRQAHPSLTQLLWKLSKFLALNLLSHSMALTAKSPIFNSRMEFEETLG